MSVEDQIYRWVRRFEPWKQELFLRAAASPELTEQEVLEVTAMLLGEKVDGAGPRKVSREDLPGAHGGDAPMVLCKIADLQNVNAIAEGQTLAFEDSGINVVYGANGAGKTGYSRVLKHAGRTLHRETVLSNVVAGAAARPRATVTSRIGDEEKEIPLELDAAAPAILGRICIEDAKAGEHYLTSETEMDYAPETLNSVRRLAEGLKAVGEEIGRRLDLAQPKEIDTRPFGEGTRVAELIKGLSPSTADDAVIALSTLSDKEEDKRKRLRRQLGEIEARQATKLREVAVQGVQAGSALLENLRKLADELSERKIDEARAGQKALEERRKAAGIAAQRFDAEPVPGAGSEPWRVLWKAARDFAEHQGQKLPPDHDPAHCLLCMQGLTPEARERLVRFDEFVEESVNARLRESERDVKARGDGLPDMETFRIRDTQTLERLGLEADQPGHKVSQWLDGAEGIVRRLKKGDLDGLKGVDPPPEEVESWITARREEAASHAALEKSDDQEKVRWTLAELDARHELRQRREEVLEHLAGLREVQRLKEAKAKASTGPVSIKMTALSRELVEANLQGALTQQLGALHFQGLAVELKARTKSGTPVVGLKFKTVEGVPLTDVLSQGEQRRLSLAMFLAEMEVLPGGSPVVLDDPVSSVDQEGRRHIAQTLAQLAADRQLIVFTHEMSFVHELRKSARSEGVPIHIQHVLQIHDTAGHVRPSLPWEGLSSRERIGPLREKLQAVRKAYETGDPDVYKIHVTGFCASLRGSFERTVEDRVLAGVVTRREDMVHTQQLDRVNCTEEICDLVDRGMAENSPWVHDRAVRDGTVIATADELQHGLDSYVELHEKLKTAEGTWSKERDKSRRRRTSKLKAAESGRDASP